MRRQPKKMTLFFVRLATKYVGLLNSPWINPIFISFNVLRNMEIQRLWAASVIWGVHSKVKIPPFRRVFRSFGSSKSRRCIADVYRGTKTRSSPKIPCCFYSASPNSRSNLAEWKEGIGVVHWWSLVEAWFVWGNALAVTLSYHTWIF